MPFRRRPTALAAILHFLLIEALQRGMSVSVNRRPQLSCWSQSAHQPATHFRKSSAARSRSSEI